MVVQPKERHSGSLYISVKDVINPQYHSLQKRDNVYFIFYTNIYFLLHDSSFSNQFKRSKSFEE